MKKSLFATCLFILTLALTACASLRPPELRGASYSNPAPPPNFTLPSTKGGDFTLNDQTGDIVLLFFGYTYCPDICPATLGTVKTALNQLAEEERQEITVVFVTIDPERDTVQRLGDYLASFNAGYIGVVPTLEDIEKLKADYGIVADKEEVQPDGSYLMAHTGLVYVIDKAGNLRAGFFSSSTAEDMAHDLKILLKE